MREIFYCIYRDVSDETLLYTSILESIIYGRYHFEKDKLIIDDSYNIDKIEKKLLSKICLNKISNFNRNLFNNWKNNLYRECFKRKYFKNIPLIGVFNTSKFKKEIKNNITQNIFNKSIIDFIDSKDKELLSKINKHLDKIHFPSFVYTSTTNYVGMSRYEMQEEARKHAGGIF